MTTTRRSTSTPLACACSRWQRASTRTMSARTPRRSTARSRMASCHLRSIRSTTPAPGASSRPAWSMKVRSGHRRLSCWSCRTCHLRSVRTTTTTMMGAAAAATTTTMTTMTATTAVALLGRQEGLKPRRSSSRARSWSRARGRWSRLKWTSSTTRPSRLRGRWSRSWASLMGRRRSAISSRRSRSSVRKPVPALEPVPPSRPPPPPTMRCRRSSPRPILRPVGSTATLRARRSPSSRTPIGRRAETRWRCWKSSMRRCSRHMRSPSPPGLRTPIGSCVRRRWARWASWTWWCLLST